MAKVGSILLLIVVGFIVADMVANQAGTKALFSGVNKVWQIMINPLNTKGL